MLPTCFFNLENKSMNPRTCDHLFLDNCFFNDKNPPVLMLIFFNNVSPQEILSNP